MNCDICLKHKDFTRFTGPVIFEAGGLLLTHFPFVESEPATAGRLLIEPKRHIRGFEEMNEVERRALGQMIFEGERRLKSVLQAEHVYLFRINDKVQHLHFHLIPRFRDTPKEFYGLNILKWVSGEALSLNQIQILAEKLKKSE